MLGKIKEFSSHFSFIISCSNASSFLFLKDYKGINFSVFLLGAPMTTDRIFLCHAHEDKDAVYEIYKKLKTEGLNPWLDKEELLVGQDFDAAIRKAIKSARFMMIFFSNNSVSKRGYVQREFKLALDTLEEIPEEDIFVLPVRLDECEVPQRFGRLLYADLFQPDGFEMVLRTLKRKIPEIKNQVVERKNEAQKSKIVKPIYSLRSVPKTLSLDEVKSMLAEKNFYDKYRNSAGKGVEHNYELQSEGYVVFDGTTGLYWQQTGSGKDMSLKRLGAHIQQLNNNKLAGYADWRLPTLEEAMSLLESSKRHGGLYIDPLFDETQMRIWTADKQSASSAWNVDFFSGFCNIIQLSSNYVRAVRSGQSII